MIFLSRSSWMVNEMSTFTPLAFSNSWAILIIASSSSL